MHNYPLWWKVIKLYKKTKNSEEKIFRLGDYRADLVHLGGVGVFLLKLLHFVSVYIV